MNKKIAEVSSQKPAAIFELMEHFYAKHIESEKQKFLFLQELTREAPQNASDFPLVRVPSGVEFNSDDSDIVSSSSDEHSYIGTNVSEKSPSKFLGSLNSFRHQIGEHSFAEVAGSSALQNTPEFVDSPDKSKKNHEAGGGFSDLIKQHKLESKLRDQPLASIRSVVEELQIQVSGQEAGFRHVIAFVKDFDKFVNDYEALFATYVTVHDKSVAGQFREVKNVMTGVTISIEELDLDTENLNVQEVLKMKRKLSDSKKFVSSG